MTTSEIEQLHDHALSLYVEGRYDEAKRAWEEIVSTAPDDSRAREGLSMLLLLAGDGRAASPGPSDSWSHESVPEVASRIDALVGARKFGDAAELARTLAARHPDSAQARTLAGSVLDRFEAEAFIEAELGTATLALQIEDVAEARRACRRVLTLDPTNRMAQELMSLADAGLAHTASAASAPAALRAGGGAESQVNLESAMDWESLEGPHPQQSPRHPRSVAEPALVRSGDSSNGSLFEMPGEIVATIPTVAQGGHPGEMPTASSAAAAAAPDDLAERSSLELKGADAVSVPQAPADARGGAGGFAGSSQEEGSLDLGFAFVDEAPEAETKKEPAAGGAAQSVQSKKIDETAHASRAVAAFSDIEDEIGENLAAPHGHEGDLDLDMGLGGEHVSGAGDAGATGSAPAGWARRPGAGADPAAGFSFGDDLGIETDGGNPPDMDAWDAPAAPSAGVPEAEQRVAALLSEARSLMEAGRFSAAIETASRAFPIDPDAPGAQQIIDEVHRRQDEAEKKFEQLLVEAREKFERGDLDAAERLFRQILLLNPAHRELRESLDQIGRRRTEAEIRKGTERLEPPPGAAQKNEDPSGAFANWPNAAVAGTGASEAGQAAAQGSRQQTEPLTPRTAEPGAMRSAPATAASPAQEAQQGRARFRLWRALAGLVTLLALAVVIGMFLANRFIGPAHVEGGPPPVIPRPARTGAAKPGKPAAEGAGSAAAAQPGKKPPASPQTRTLQQAKALAAEGKLEDARAVLASIVVRDAADQQAVRLLEDVQSRLARGQESARVNAAIASAYKQERYEDALRMLYRLPAEMQTGDVERYKANAWFNNGRVSLLGGNCTEAIRCFDEALNIDPKDEQIRRLRDYAQSYLERSKDTAYRIYVEGLPVRPLDARP